MGIEGFSSYENSSNTFLKEQLKWISLIYYLELLRVIQEVKRKELTQIKS
jgi:hypothetical protein